MKNWDKKNILYSKIAWFSFILLLFLFLLSCLQCKIQLFEEIKKTKINNIQNAQEIQIGCMDFKYFPNEIIINSREEYNQLLVYKAPHPDCRDYQLPEIDFSNKTLLGYKTITGGCKEPKYIRTVMCNNKTQTCTYNISIKQKGLCKIGWMSMNWIVVDKINNQFEISFEVIRKSKK